MYGGIYIHEIGARSSHLSEVFSHCDPSNSINGAELEFKFFVVVIVHYREYSGPTIIFDAEYKYLRPSRMWPVNLKPSDTKKCKRNIGSHVSWP